MNACHISLSVVGFAYLFLTSDAFSTSTSRVVSFSRQTSPIQTVETSLVSLSASQSDSSPIFERVSEEDEGVPIPFLDRTENSFIECYADSVITIKKSQYTIGVPCDYCVALCYFEGENLIPVELNDDLMNDIFPIAENIVSEEFDEELVLQRTPQTLTLVGELEDDENDRDEEEDDDDDDLNGEEVEVLLTFDHRDKEFNLVRMLDPVLLVGKTDAERPDLRILLTLEESEKIMPILEKTFLNYHDDGDSMLLP